MKNVTITMSEKLLRQARVKAAEQDKSLSRYVADLFAERVGSDADERAKFLETFHSIKPVRLREPGQRRSTRDELYDRKLFRR
jgi:hypothetical protein